MNLIRRRPVPTTPEPAPSYSQDEQRARRRKWLTVEYGNSFDLGIEVEAILRPLVTQVAALPSPLALRRWINDVADAVHEVVSTVVGMLAEADLDADAHARTVQRVRDLAQRPTAPELNDEQIRGGTWADVLTSYAAPLSADLAAHLGRLRPGDPILTASSRLVAALRVLDQAAHELQQIIPRAVERQALPTIEQFNAAQRERRDRDRADRAVAQMRTTYKRTGAHT